MIWQAPQESAPGLELGFCAADLAALGWVDQDHVAAAAAALSSPVCLATAASLQADTEPASQRLSQCPGPLSGELAAEVHTSSASQALASAIPKGAELLQEQHATSEHLAGSQAQLGFPGAAVSSPPAQPDSMAPAGPQRSRKRAQPEPVEARVTLRSGDGAAHACRQTAGLATALAPAAQSPVLRPEPPAWLQQQVASLGASYTGVPASPAGQPGEEAASAAALLGRRVAFVLLEDFVAQPDAHFGACVIRAGLHSGRCDCMLPLLLHRALSHLSRRGACSILHARASCRSDTLA